LGPLLFSLYINDIPNVLQNCSYLYADDLQIYYHFDKTATGNAIQLVNRDLCRILNFVENHNLTLNVSKTQSFLLGSNRSLRQLARNQTPAVNIGGVPIDGLSDNSRSYF